MNLTMMMIYLMILKKVEIQQNFQPFFPSYSEYLDDEVADEVADEPTGILPGEDKPIFGGNNGPPPKIDGNNNEPFDETVPIFGGGDKNNNNGGSDMGPPLSPATNSPVVLEVTSDEIKYAAIGG